MILEKSVYLKGASTLFRNSSKVFEDAKDFMWIDTSRRYLVTTGLISSSPPKAIANPVHYIELDGGVISVRLPKSDSWIPHDCRKEIDGLWWTIKEKEYFWQYVDIDEVPDWAHDTFRRGIAQLEAYPA